MKKLLPVLLLGIFLFSAITASAGWTNSAGFACDPETSEPGTCFYEPDLPNNRRAAAPDKEWATIIKNLIGFNPFF